MVKTSMRKMRKMNKIITVIHDLPECHFCRVNRKISVPATYHSVAFISKQPHYMCDEHYHMLGSGEGKKVHVVSLGSEQNE